MKPTLTSGMYSDFFDAPVNFGLTDLQPRLTQFGPLVERTTSREGEVGVECRQRLRSPPP